MLIRNRKHLISIAFILAIIVILSSCNKKASSDKSGPDSSLPSAELTVPETEPTVAPTTNPQGIIFGKTKGWATSSLRLRKEPNATSEIIGGVALAGELIILGIEGDWYKVLDRAQEGYVSAQYVSLVPLDGTTTASSEATTTTTLAEN